MSKGLSTGSFFEDFCCKGYCGILLLSGPRDLVSCYSGLCIVPSLASQLSLGLTLPHKMWQKPHCPVLGLILKRAQQLLHCWNLGGCCKRPKPQGRSCGGEQGGPALNRPVRLQLPASTKHRPPDFPAQGSLQEPPVQLIPHEAEELPSGALSPHGIET